LGQAEKSALCKERKAVGIALFKKSQEDLVFRQSGMDGQHQERVPALAPPNRIWVRN
jgi:hypothetical protein